MKLRLNVITYRNQPTSMPMGTEFGMDGGTIGRAAENDWVLPDPERFISGKHAKISLQNGQFYLTDTSTNGIYFNAQPQPMGNGNSTPLSNGDRILIGDYEIEVILENNQTDSETLPDSEEDFFNPLSPTPSIPDAFPGIDNTYELDNTGPVASPYPTSSDTASESFSASDHVASENQFFQPPQSIPEDWDLLEDDPDDASDIASSQLTAPLPEPLPAADATPVPSPQTPADSDLGSLNKLLDGAGIQPLDLPPQEAAEVLRIIGSLMRELIGGVMEVLRARADIKSEFRMQLTTIRPVENNPLKFSVGVEDALNHLLGPSNDAYLPPLESVHQAIEDIEAHQLAVMAGMQAALSSMLQRFEPGALEEYFARKGGRSLLESKKAWYWEQYADKHKEILMEAEDNFQDLFGEEFARAYELQISKLAQARKIR